MRDRPRISFIRRFHQEPVPDEKRRAFLKCYRTGGLKSYELIYMLQMTDVSLAQPGTTDPLSGDFMKWVYVGELWWCRQRKPRRGDLKGRVSYEFSRCVAMRFNKGKNGLEIEGLWDTRRHAERPEPEIVYKKADPKCKGYIVGHNEFEVIVSWEDGETLRRGIGVPVRVFSDLIFEFTEDAEKYAKIFDNYDKLAKKSVPTRPN